MPISKEYLHLCPFQHWNPVLPLDSKTACMEVVQSFGMPLVNCPSFACVPALFNTGIPSCHLILRQLVVQSFGMPLVNCPRFACVCSTTDLYTFSFVSSLIPLRSQILPRSRCCASFGNPSIDFIINVHNSRQCASR